MRRDPRLVLNASTQNLFHSSLKYEQIWTVIPLSVPKMIRQCPRCNGNTFCSSDKFRINANKKVLDVWLIYKCSQCEFTWKNSIIRRTPVSKMDKGLLKRLEDNDKTLAWQYAFDPSFSPQGAPIDWNIDFDIQVQSNENSQPDARGIDLRSPILIQSDYFLKIPLLVILRDKLQISRTQLEKMQESSNLKVYNLKGDSLTLKANLGKGCIVCIKAPDK